MQAGREQVGRIGFWNQGVTAVFAPKIVKPQTKAPDSPTRKLVLQPSKLVARPLGGGAIEQELMLQRTIGNQATLRYLTHRLSNLPSKGPAERHEQEATPENMTAREAPRGTAWDFSKIPVVAPDRANRPRARSSLSPLPLPGTIQPKLVVGEVNDPLEREADRVADHVMRGAEAGPALVAEPRVSRTCAACEAEETARRTAAPPAPAGSEAPASVGAALAAPGRPLDAALRSFFEPRFARDLSSVRVHTDARADVGARAIGAKAFAAGQDVVFGAGQWSPGSAAGRRLIAHELAHVLQQGGVPAAIRRAPQDVPAMDAALQAALAAGNMGEAARVLNGFSPTDMLSRLAALTPAQRAAVQAASLTTPGVGPQSAVADFATASPQARFYSDADLGASFDGLADPGNGVITLYKRIRFSADGAQFGAAAPGTPGWEEETAAGKRKFAEDFKAAVEAAWSGQGTVKPACPIGTVTSLRTRVKVIVVDAGEQAVVNIITHGSGRSNASEGQGNLQPGDNQPRTRTVQGVDPTGTQPVDVTTTHTTSAHEFGHMVGLHHVRCPGGDDNCYGVTAEQMQDVMGRGDKLQVLKTRGKVVHDDFEPFERIAQRWGRDAATGAAARCNTWSAST